MKDKKKIKLFNLNSSISAAIVMILLMFAFGSFNRILFDLLLTSPNMRSVSPDSLAEFPMEIGLWTGEEAPLDETIVEATDTDAHISRNYSKNNDSESVWFYVAFGQRTRDLIPHRPEVCYKGQGWTLAKSQSEEIALNDGTKLPCRIMQFDRGSFLKPKEKVVILNYYIVDGSLCRDVSMLRKKIWQEFVSLLMNRISRRTLSSNYISQIQIVAPLKSNYDSESTEKTISEFAVESAPLLLKLTDSFEKPGKGKTEINNISEEKESE